MGVPIILAGGVSLRADLAPPPVVTLFLLSVLADLEVGVAFLEGEGRDLEGRLAVDEALAAFCGFFVTFAVEVLGEGDATVFADAPHDALELPVRAVVAPTLLPMLDADALVKDELVDKENLVHDAAAGGIN